MQTLLGITGLVWAQPVADVLSLILVAVLYIFTMRKMKTKSFRQHIDFDDISAANIREFLT